MKDCCLSKDSVQLGSLNQDSFVNLLGLAGMLECQRILNFASSTVMFYLGINGAERSLG